MHIIVCYCVYMCISILLFDKGHYIMKITATIMAGGKGERFWPASRNNCPKQFLSLTSDGKTMLQKTAERLLPLIDYKDIFIVTNKSYLNLVKAQLPQIPEENIILEPVGRNTAPCIALAAKVAEKHYNDAVMVVLPSDHIIKDEERFLDYLKKGISAAETGENLITIGITPSYPETGYGYIKFIRGNSLSGDVYAVERFVEKPVIEKAREYVASGNYLWNSGMFVWKTSTILSNIEKYLPAYIPLLDEIVSGANFNDKVEEVFPRFRADSVDYAIMEKAENIYTLPSDFGWDDVGSWLALERINTPDENGNYLQGNVIAADVKNNTIIGGKKLVAAVGVEDLIIVDTDDVILVCAKNSAQDVKKIVGKLKESKLNEYL